MFKSLIVGFALAVSCVFASEPVIEDHVLVLNEENYHKTITENEFVMVEFYAPWCGHCQQLAPEYSAAAEKAASLDPKVILAKVDATENEELAQQNMIQGFPTIFFFKNGQKYEFNGGRDAEGILKYINSKTGPPSQEVDCATLESKIFNEKFVFTYFGETEGDLYNAHIGLSDANDRASHLNLNDAECAKKFGVEMPGLVFFKQYDQETLIYSGETNVDALGQFFRLNSLPSIMTISDEFGEDIFESMMAVFILFHKDDTLPVVATFKEAALANKGKAAFAYSGIEEGLQEGIAEYLGVTEGELPSIMVLRPQPESLDKFAYRESLEELTVQKLNAFVDDILEGKLQPFSLSEPVPEINDGPVTKVVGSQFNEIVMDESKDVFIKFYSPSCPHCIEIAPAWEELGKNFSDNEDLIIADFDGASNELPNFQIDGFPTLVLFKKGTKATEEPLLYEGPREVEDLIKFVEENSVVLNETKKEATHDEL